MTKIVLSDFPKELLDDFEEFITAAPFTVAMARAKFGARLMAVEKDGKPILRNQYEMDYMLAHLFQKARKEAKITFMKNQRQWVPNGKKPRIQAPRWIGNIRSVKSDGYSLTIEFSAMVDQNVWHQFFRDCVVVKPEEEVVPIEDFDLRPRSQAHVNRRANKGVTLATSFDSDWWRN